VGFDDGDSTAFLRRSTSSRSRKQSSSLSLFLLLLVLVVPRNRNSHLELHLKRKLPCYPQQNVRRRRVGFEEELRRGSVRATNFVGIEMDEVGEGGGWGVG